MAHTTNARILTPNLAHAAGWDAGNANMRKAGRKRWNLEDWNVAADKTNRLMAYIMPRDVVEGMLKHGMIDADHPALTHDPH